MKRVVITGATSMIGVALVKECIRHNVEVLAVVQRQSRKVYRLPESDLITLCKCNLDELCLLEPDGKRYDVFYHFAWGYTARSDRDNPLLQIKNIQYTLDAVELAKKLGCSKFVGAGSQAEYGIVHEVIDAKTRVSPISSYGIAKYAAGLLSAKLCAEYQIIQIWGRIFSVYGCNDSEETMISYAVNQFLKAETARFSSGTQYWDYLFEEDAGKIFYYMGERVNESRVYRIANGRPRPLREFILELKETISPNSKCEFDSNTDISNMVSLRVDISDLIKEIGYSPETDFREGIERVVEYWRHRV